MPLVDPVRTHAARRQGGAGPADAGMLWIDGFAATVPTSSDYAHASPYVLRAEDDTDRLIAGRHHL